ncbi:MAG: DUF983 domain-containing protein [Flavitalea sp.]
MNTLVQSGTGNDMPVSQQKTERNPGITRLLACKCPRCRRGDMFASKNPWKLNTTMKMNPSCAVCGQPFDIEVGFYYGSGYVSYALSVAISVASFIAAWVIVGFSLQDNRFFYWMFFNAILLIAAQPYLMRVARTGWLAFFIGYNKNWSNEKPLKPERTNELHKSNW